LIIDIELDNDWEEVLPDCVGGNEVKEGVREPAPRKERGPFEANSLDSEGGSIWEVIRSSS